MENATKAPTSPAATREQVNEILLAALELDAGERAGYLETACGQDDMLKREVASLLNADPLVLEELDRPIGRLVVPAETESGDEGDGGVREIGPYEVVREIGRGGMGAVYLGFRQADELRQPVAIKVLKPGMNSEEIVRRFHQERRILANLRHPGIARLFEGGHTADGRPYFVMEYVEGEPMDHYCDSRRLDLRQRLKLFRKVCSAVAFAHQNLVIHRDLKPGNILVLADGEPRLVDFGIAKLLAPTTLPNVTATGVGLGFMTLEYASPEQVRGEPMTTATDIYSLGVLLYRLLTGESPYHLAGRGGDEIRRRILESTPEPPSQLAPDAAKSRQRRLEPRALRRRLAGDLDNIALMALRKEPRRRYASVEQLALDVERHLEGHPVAARKDTFSYRTGKFLRRRWREVGATTLILLLSATFALDRHFQQRRIAQERDHAREVTRFLTRLFEVSDPSEARGNSVLAREILDRGAREVESELVGQPELQATLMGTMGKVYRSLGLYKEAKPLLERSLEERRRIHRADHPDIGESLNELGHLLQNMGDYTAAEPLHHAALEIFRRAHGEKHPSVAAALNDLGSVALHQGRLEEAERLYRQALAQRRELLAEDDEDVAVAVNNLAGALSMQGKYALAEPLCREALARHRRLLGQQDPLLATFINNLAGVLRQQGSYGAAEPLYREALELRQRLLGGGHPKVGYSLNNLAYLLRALGRHEDAEPLQREALAVLREALGEHRHVARLLHNLGLLMWEGPQPWQAESYLLESMEMRRRILGDKHPDLAESMVVIGGMMRGRGQLEEAEILLDQALEIFRGLQGSSHPYEAAALRQKALLLSDRGDASGAEAAAWQALTLRVRLLGEEHPETAVSRIDLARLLLTRKKHAEAQRLATKALATLRGKLPPGHKSVLEAEELLAATQLDTPFQPAL